MPHFTEWYYHLQVGTLYYNFWDRCRLCSHESEHVGVTDQLYQVNKFIGLLIYIVKLQRILAHQQEYNAVPALSHSTSSQYHHKYNSRYGYWDSPITS
ncbi:hypothetical protein CANARDRAFT_29424 [[Candida] arabinofermentans NRRL YB-2248]|uniref:Uncharacterized protein n=1 Tax=[Candida] arabinofermentans NRRL YB-2248 TaxID=983967 RepID=A0A1E4SXR2_9ASCO|nr:hypothetical protein CANARDRAFT_29424 [[Candida] arabinofermentans NRRL YB-2248]